MDAATENRTRPSMAKVRVEVTLTKTKILGHSILQCRRVEKKKVEELEDKENRKIRQNDKVQVEEIVDVDNVVENNLQEAENEAEKQGLDKPQETSSTRMDHSIVEANESVGDGEDKKEIVTEGQLCTAENTRPTASDEEKQQCPKIKKATKENENSQQARNINNEQDGKDLNETDKADDTDQNNSATEEYVADSQEEEKQDSSSRGLEEVGFITSSVDTYIRNQQGIQLFVDLNTGNGEDINNTSSVNKDGGEEKDDKLGDVNSSRQSEQELPEQVQEHIDNTPAESEQAGILPIKILKGKSKKRSKKRKEVQNKSTL
ncbi:uncharacterized protein LOC132615817 [Lycium barbarum]|uniref:uncharacterized protein LOC132615817 n=1 Tax=Lycium barbarum TaxID=112863 RepID=UPI00293EEB0C|nr:uncharacterized protein LOC132615817 [Lycium barbarum]